MSVRFKRPSPAFVVATIALFVALGGTAGAVAVVPLAKRALVADNAKKLGGFTPVQLGVILLKASQQVPGPASTAAGLVTTSSASFTLTPSQGEIVNVSCGAGQKAVGGGFITRTTGLVASVGSYPMPEGSGWVEDLQNFSDTLTPQGTVFATCLK